jgi:hypothetical protein
MCMKESPNIMSSQLFWVVMLSFLLCAGTLFLAVVILLVIYCCWVDATC